MTKTQTYTEFRLRRAEKNIKYLEDRLADLTNLTDFVRFEIKKAHLERSQAEADLLQAKKSTARKLYERLTA